MRYPCLLKHARLIAMMMLGATSAAVGGEADAIHARTWVPNRLLPQGEVRLIHDDDTVIVQTALWTRHLDLVVDRIVSKERSGWGDDPSAAAYIQALRDAVARLEREAPNESPRGLLIEFVTTPSVSEIVFRRAHLAKSDTGLVIQRATLLNRIELGSAYIRSNQWRIIEDSFGRGSGNVTALLQDFLSSLAPQKAAHE